ncbi:MAG: hypothetical protein ACK48X_15325, partial [Planctomycetota bacterium]
MLSKLLLSNPMANATAFDYSTRHEPVSDLFRWPRSEQEWDRYRLTPEQVAFFHAQGYLPKIRILSPEQVEYLRGELAGLMQSDHPGRELWYEY